MRRNSAQAIAASRQRSARALRHFINNSPWDHEAILAHLRARLKRPTGKPTATLVLDECVVARRGRKSVGVVRHLHDWSGIYYHMRPVNKPRRSVLGQLALTLHWYERTNQMPVGMRTHVPPFLPGRPRVESGLDLLIHRRKHRCRAAVRFIAEIAGQLPPFQALLLNRQYGRCFSFLAALEKRTIPYLARWPRCWPQVAPVHIYPLPSRENPQKRAWYGRGARYYDWLGYVFRGRGNWLPFEVPEASDQLWELSAMQVDSIPLGERWREHRRKRWYLFVRRVGARFPDRWNSDGFISNLPPDTRTHEFAELIQQYYRVEAERFDRQAPSLHNHFEGRSARGFHHHVVLWLLASALAKRGIGDPTRQRPPLKIDIIYR